MPGLRAFNVQACGARWQGGAEQMRVRRMSYDPAWHISKQSTIHSASQVELSSRLQSALALFRSVSSRCASLWLFSCAIFSVLTSGSRALASYWSPAGAS